MTGMGETLVNHVSVAHPSAKGRFSQNCLKHNIHFNKNVFQQDVYRPLQWPPLDASTRGWACLQRESACRGAVCLQGVCLQRGRVCLQMGGGVCLQREDPCF